MGVRVPSFAPRSRGSPSRPLQGRSRCKAVGNPSPLERRRQGGRSRGRAIEAEIATHQEARAHREDAGLPARQGAHQDGRAPLRRSRCARRCSRRASRRLRRGGARRRTSAWPACRASSPSRAATGWRPSSSRRSSRSIPRSRIGDLAGRPVARPVTEVTEKDVDATIETLRKQRAKYERGRAARRATWSTSTSRARSTAPPSRAARARTSPCVLGEGRMLPDFEAALMGLGRGDRSLPIVISRTTITSRTRPGSQPSR